MRTSATVDNSATELLAELIAEAIGEKVGNVGVLVRDVPPPDPGRLLELLESMRSSQGVDLRVAYLRKGGSEAAKKLRLDSTYVSDSVEQAERWRNDPKLSAMIVVIAHGDEAKLSSLEDFAPITSRDLKRVLVRLATSDDSRAGQNDVQLRWWKILGTDDGIGLGQLIEYFLELQRFPTAQYPETSSRALHLLGLLPDPRLFDDPKERAVMARLESNRDLIVRLQVLTPKDRKAMSRTVDGETVADEKKRLRTALQSLEDLRWRGKGLQAITYQDAERLLRVRKQKEKSPKPKPTTEAAKDVAAESLVDVDRAADLGAIVDAFRDQLNELQAASLRTQVLRAPLASVGAEAILTVRPDTLNLVGKVLDEGVYGGLVVIDAPDLEGALRRFDRQHVVARWERQGIDEFLQFMDDSGGLRSAFDAYDRARNAVLPLARTLAIEPLLVAANPSTRQSLQEMISAYEALTRSALDAYEQLFARFGADVTEAFARLVLLDTIVFRVSGKVYAMAAPTHPLYLWHYTRFCALLEEQRDRLDERDRALVTTAATKLPNFLISLFVPALALGESKVLPFAGRIGPLPTYSEVPEASSSDDGIDSVRMLIETHLALEPHTRLGLRIALVDPPNAGAYLSMLVDLADEGLLEGAHLAVFRHAGKSSGAELRLDEDEEDRIAQRFRAMSVERRFTYFLHDLRDHEVGPPSNEQFHLLVLFDRSLGQANRVRPAAHPIQPLALPRRITYRQVHKTVELEPSSGGPFEGYEKLVGRVGPGGGPSYFAVHQDEKLRKDLAEIATRIPWVVLADRTVDRDLNLGGIRITSNRDGERDVAGFAHTTAAFRRPLRDVVRNYNAFISQEELDALLKHLSDLLDTGLLNLRPDSSGKTNHNRIKGVLGTLIAARWFLRSKTGQDRFLVSLDGAEARRWMHLSDDPVQADLLGLEWSDDHCTVSVIEVKAVQTSVEEYTVKDGLAEGSAIQQVLSTRRLLASVLAKDRTNELITTPARREAVREQFYRELTKGTYSADERKVWADRLQRLLEGEVSAELRCQVVHVRLGVDSGSLTSRNATAIDGDQRIAVQITELNERLIDSLCPPDSLPPGSEQPVGRVLPVAPDGEAAGPALREQVPDTSAVLPEDAVPAGEITVDRPRAFLGTAPGTYGKVREIWFDPHLPAERLPNPHISITGETGSGKTQAIKAIASDLCRAGVSSLTLDFKDDYSDPAYAEAEGARVYDPTVQRLPFNPLAPPVDPRSGQVNPTNHIYQIVEIIKRVYDLGDQQANRLRQSIKDSYEHVGLSIRPFTPKPEQRYPPFDLLVEHLDPGEDGKLLGRLSPIFDLSLFTAEPGHGDFAKVLASTTVVRLGQLPGDEVKNSVAEFFLMALYNYLIRQPQAHVLRRLLILDEAWRLIKSPFLTPLLREGRAFGLGVLIASQFPKDLPSDIAGSTATRLFFSQAHVDHLREIQRALIGKTSGAEADHVAGIVRSLPPLTCLMQNKQYSPFVRVTIKPYFERSDAAS